MIDRAGWPPERIVMSGPRPERLRDLEARLGVRTSDDNRQAVAQGQVVVLSVKPQTLPEVAGGLTGAIPAGSLVLSNRGRRSADRIEPPPCACGRRPGDAEHARADRPGDIRVDGDLRRQP